MERLFDTIGLVGYPRNKEGLATHIALHRWLTERGYTVLVERQLSEQLSEMRSNGEEIDEIGRRADLVIVIGGDGNMLRAVRMFAQYHTKLIGVNRGSLGFLTDILPEEAESTLEQVLAGKYIQDDRFLLEINLYHVDKLIASHIAVNEIVLHSNKIATLIDFDVYIRGEIAFSQRADGLIIATPTGSTAYSLSAGSAIIEPSLEAIALVPMFPHSLTARPLIVSNKDTISVHFKRTTSPLGLSCDSQNSIIFDDTHRLEIKTSSHRLNLIHPLSYDYFRTLTDKLGWATKWVK